MLKFVKKSCEHTQYILVFPPEEINEQCGVRVQIEVTAWIRLKIIYNSTSHVHNVLPSYD